MADPQPILVDVPICSFRPYASREYQDTYPVPSPATVYGMLLSLVGEPASADTDVFARHRAKERHRGADIAIAVEQLPPHSKVFRKLRRGPDLEDTRPDYQDLLVGMRMWLWLRKGTDTAETPLCDRVMLALLQPPTIQRFGGLSLGESSYLVDSVSLGHEPPDTLRFLIPDVSGFYALPVWVDHTAASQSRKWRFRISEALSPDLALKQSWVGIGTLQE